MTNKKKNVEKDAIKPIKQELQTSESNEDEQKIQKELEVFESEMRMEFEKILKAKKKAKETRLRGQIPIYKFNKKRSYEIHFFVMSSRMIEQPFFSFFIEVEGSLNEFDFAKVLEEATNSNFDSRVFREWQKNQYYKLRMMGIEPDEIYSRLDLRYSMMDKNEKTLFRSRLKADFRRRKAKQKDYENGKT